MDKDKCQDWIEQLESEQLIALADSWGIEIAQHATDSGLTTEDFTKKLKSFTQWLIEYYGYSVMPSEFNEDPDEWHDNLDRNGDRQ